MKKIIFSSLACLALFSSALFAGSYNVDTVHSSAEFKIKHLQVSNVKGNFTKFVGDVEFDEAGKKITKLDAVIDVSSVNTHNTKRDDHLKSADFFDTAKFKDMKFVMTEFIPDGNEGTVVGNLTIKGVTKPVKLEYEFGGISKDKGGKSIIGFTLEGKINRTDFNVGESSLALSDEVKLNIEVEAREK